MTVRVETVRALAVLDSRGSPTVEAEVLLTDGTSASAQAPSGASTGRHEARELRDGPGGGYDGKAVLAAVANVNDELADELSGLPAGDHGSQERADRIMIGLDGTPDKSRLGANAILAVSCALARASARSQRVPLWEWLAGDRKAKMPLPMVNILSGGLHAGRQIEMQDFLAVPHGFTTFADSLEAVVRIHDRMRRILEADGRQPDGVADEGGWGARLDSNEQALQYMTRAIESAGLEPGRQVSIAVDVAASHFHRDGEYRLASEGRTLDAVEMVALYERWIGSYPLVAIEDPLAEDDWDGWKRGCNVLAGCCDVVGDDLLVTSRARLDRAIAERAATAVLVKMNQVGTLTETMEVVDRAERAGLRAIVSARSGETEDAFLADLAVASGAGHIKIGSVTRSERLAKYNRLLRIEAGWDGSEPEGLAPVRPLGHDGSGGGRLVNDA